MEVYAKFDEIEEDFNELSQTIQDGEFMDFFENNLESGDEIIFKDVGILDSNTFVNFQMILQMSKLPILSKEEFI